MVLLILSIRPGRIILYHPVATVLLAAMRRPWCQQIPSLAVPRVKQFYAAARPILCTYCNLRSKASVARKAQTTSMIIALLPNLDVGITGWTLCRRLV